MASKSNLGKELASQTHKATGTAGSTHAATTLHVHLQGHLGSVVDSRLLVTGLKQPR